MNTLHKLSIACVLVLAAQASQATPITWTDTIDFNPSVYITQWTGFTYQHDIKNEGFDPSTDTLSGFSLGVDLYNTAGQGFLALVIPGGLNNGYFDLSGFDLGGWALEGDAELQTTGLLTVTIISLLGNFYLGASTLTAFGSGPGTTTVPEPGTLALLAIGLLVVAFAVRRSRRARGGGLT